MLHRTLLIDDRVPDPNFGAGFPRAYRMLLCLGNLGHKIYFYPNVKESIKEVNPATLKVYGVEICKDLYDLPKDINLIIVSRPHNCHYHMPVAKKMLPDAKVIYDTEALWYRRYDMQKEITGKLPSWAYRYDELGMARNVDLCFVVNDIEKKILEENNVKKVVKLGHALDVHEEGQPFERRNGFLVVGGILEEDSSNEDALWEYCKNSWDEVNARTCASLFVTGHKHSQRLKETMFQNVEFMGHVPNLIPEYESRRVFIASTRFATGIPWKVHEAMAAGLPCVISQLLADQLGVTDGNQALVAKNWKEFKDKSVELYFDKSLWQKVRENAFGLIRKDCDPEKFASILKANIDGLF